MLSLSLSSSEILVRERVIERMGAVGKEVRDFVMVDSIVIRGGETSMRFLCGRGILVKIVLRFINGVVRAPFDNKTRGLYEWLLLMKRGYRFDPSNGGVRHGQHRP